MPNVSRLGDVSTGHCYGSRPNDQASPNVFADNKAVHRQGDHWVTHCCGPPCHDSVLARGSSTVFVNGKQCARIGDPIACGDAIATGGPTVFAGG